MEDEKAGKERCLEDTCWITSVLPAVCVIDKVVSEILQRCVK